jgi:putative flippase GtrA
MEQSFVPRDLNGVLETKNGSVEQETALSHKPGYHPTRWEAVNRVLDIVDRVTNGRAGVFQRLFSYLFIGGTAAVVNLVVFTVLYRGVELPIDSKIHNIIASTISFEISLMANFIPNDYFTFRHLNGHNRSWLARCGRFHITAIGGYLLTLFVQFCVHFFFHVDSVLAQAAAILVALFYNFTVHHLFTYRHIKTDTVEPLAVDASVLQVLSPERVLETEDALKLATVVSSSDTVEV